VRAERFEQDGRRASVFREREDDDALAEIETVIAASPDNARAWQIKGNALGLKQDPKGAADSLAHSLSLKKDVNVEFALGSAYLRAGEKAKAQQVFQSMLASYGDRAIWHVVFAGAYREAQMMPDAIAEFRKGIALDPNVDNAHFFLGLTLLEQNMWARTDCASNTGVAPARGGATRSVPIEDRGPSRFCSTEGIVRE